jgi:Right handed beta helix region
MGLLVVLCLLLVLVAPVALLIHGSRPKSGAASGLSAQASDTTTRLPASCARTAHDGQSLANAYAAATPGQTVCLASGGYGKFIAGRKPGLVGIRAQRGARVTMALEFDSVVDLHIDGVIVTSALIEGASRNITIAHSHFTGLAVVLTDQMVNANIRFDHNVHANVNTCTSCYAGRLHIEGTSKQPAGLVVSNSVFSGGDSDGVRADANGIKVIDNEFFGFVDRAPFHTDPIQIYGGTNVLIRGNYFHDNSVSAQIMMADGGSHNLVEDNVISPGGYTWAITWFSDDGSIIQHNTFADGQCNDGVRCGMLNLGAKAQDPAGRGTVIRDNVLGGIGNHGEAKDSAFTADHNLTEAATPGAHNLRGTPRFRGPLRTFAGYRLAPGSPGAHDAPDGTNLGIR